MAIQLGRIRFLGIQDSILNFRIYKIKWSVAVFLKVCIPGAYLAECGAHSETANIESPAGKADQISLIQAALYLASEKPLSRRVPESSFYFSSVIHEPE